MSTARAGSPRLAAPRFPAIWWVLIAVLLVTAGEAEHVRRVADPPPGLCLGSAVLLQGAACPKPTRMPELDPL